MNTRDDAPLGAPEGPTPPPSDPSHTPTGGDQPGAGVPGRLEARGASSGGDEAARSEVLGGEGTPSGSSDALTPSGEGPGRDSEGGEMPKRGESGGEEPEADAGEPTRAEAEASGVEEAAPDASASDVPVREELNGEVGGDTDASAGPEFTADTSSSTMTSPPSGIPSSSKIPSSSETPPPSEPADSEPPTPHGPAPTTLAALSLRTQVAVAGVVAIVAAVVVVHVGMVFLHVAPSNTVSKAHAEAVDDWIYPEFEQNWKLFAPNPLQQDIAVQVRAEVRSSDGGYRTTGWYDLSAADGRSIDGNLLPSHTQQNELRRAWDFFTGTHDNDNRAVGMRGALSEEYLRRIVVMRLERAGAVKDGGALARVQVRSRTSNVPPPKWSDEKVSTQPNFRVLPWWRVSADEANGSVK